MKQKIDPKDIRKGDLIRAEYGRVGEAVEYRASGNGTRWDAVSTHYLLERPEPPFKPLDGMHIQRNEDESYYSAVRIDGEWLAMDPDDRDRHWFGDIWAKQKLAEGWVIIDKQEGVK